MEERLIINNFDVTDNIIKVIGVGGGGGNAVNNMLKKGVNGVHFVVCNTDAQDLEKSLVPTKIQLGESGLGAGSKAEKGREAAENSREKIEQLLSDGTRMVFITASMGGGTGTGAAPVIAQIAKEKGILTVGIVTIPYQYELEQKIRQALSGVQQMQKSVSTASTTAAWGPSPSSSASETPISTPPWAAWTRTPGRTPPTPSPT